MLRTTVMILILEQLCPENILVTFPWSNDALLLLKFYVARLPMDGKSTTPWIQKDLLQDGTYSQDIF